MGKIAAAFKLPRTVICVTDKTQPPIGDLPYPNNGLAQCGLIRPLQPREMPNPKSKIVRVSSTRAHFMHHTV
jgi:hypothetical protein